MSATISQALFVVPLIRILRLVSFTTKAMGTGEYFAQGSDVALRYGRYIVVVKLRLVDAQFTLHQQARVVVSSDHRNVVPLGYFASQKPSRY
eukprot:m.322775 g.322775  ORF g.322775 m.322775 type:complete len:92 (+) comp19719_c11_seq3:922-1197(+)